MRPEKPAHWPAAAMLERTGYTGKRGKAPALVRKVCA
jgi:hypothetical protein